MTEKNVRDAALSRREALTGSIAAAAAIGAFGAARAQGPGQIPGSATIINTEFKALTPNVYAFLQREAKGQSNLSVSNCGVVVGPQSMLAIDTTGGPAHARKFLARSVRQRGLERRDIIAVEREVEIAARHRE